MSKKLRAMECNIIIMAIMAKYGACIIFPPQTRLLLAMPPPTIPLTFRDVNSEHLRLCVTDEFFGTK